MWKEFSLKAESLKTAVLDGNDQEKKYDFMKTNAVFFKSWGIKYLFFSIGKWVMKQTYLFS